MQNNPINRNDPSGHKACSNKDANGECNTTEQKLENLVDYTDSKVLNKKGKLKYSSLKSTLMVVRKAASLYGNNWADFLDGTTYVFTGYYGHGASLMWKAHRSGEVGLIDGDSGFHSDFQDADDSQQVRHFWAGFSTAANPTGDNPWGVASANMGNNFHEITQDTKKGIDGATVIDYQLTLTAIDIATQTGNQISTPMP